ncbi:drug/metabolite transporter (DMT)-like permease [Allocatelliglobosispora scoriae]|uniref:Drug/metabolite transporter (DMT)-like permease n=2 Tax=Allocatelliglobosispora scoriae TaxID=643052 RepID=A0A841BNH2_9ACTN|nr:drug/metabolite transporter (DMT)-like permease [Allocatelliglobosispora scoriae]
MSQILGLPIIALGLVIIPGTPHLTDILYGMAAGVAGLGGIVLLYRGLSGGAMSVVAPITAVTSAFIPVIGGLLMGERPNPIALVGAVCAIAAIGLVSLGHSQGRGAVTPKVVLLALSAGALFGAFFLILRFADSAAGMWPMVGVRASSIPIGLFLIWRAGASLRLPRGSGALTMAAGLGDNAANMLYLLAVQRGDLSVIAPIAALYPTSTVLLALLVEKERLRPIQFGGLALAAAALVLSALPTT